jgi:NAD(P)H-hydrate epimerase
MTVDAFVTRDGVRVPAITTDQMREVDRVAIDEVGPNLYQMMENAGRNLALTVIDRLGPDWASTPVVVLSGTGGNGGGGICAARHLANRGANVALVISDPARLTPVPGEQFRVYRGTNGAVASVADRADLEAGIIVDAMIGYSLGGAPRGAVETMIEWAMGRPVPVIALDVPSGIDSTTGEALGAYVSAAATLTLALPKTGLGVAAVGELQLADIGIPAEVYRRIGVDVPPALFGARYRVALEPA